MHVSIRSLLVSRFDWVHTSPGATSMDREIDGPPRLKRAAKRKPCEHCGALDGGCLCLIAASKGYHPTSLVKPRAAPKARHSAPSARTPRATPTSLRSTLGVALHEYLNTDVIGMVHAYSEDHMWIVNKQDGQMERYRARNDDWVLEDAGMSPKFLVEGGASIKCEMFLVGLSAITHTWGVARWESEKLEWSPIAVKEDAAISAARQGGAMAVLGDQIYLMGALGGVGTTRCERFDLTAGWTSLAPMNIKRAQNTAASLESSGEVMVLAGRDGGTLFRSCELYDVKSDRWESVAELKDARRCCAAVGFDTSVYAVGGHGNRGAVLASVERYDRKDNKWTVLQPMNTPRYYAAAVVFNGRLVVVGGHGPQAGPLHTAEQYDHVSNTWDDLAPMSAKGLVIPLVL